jgi:hypothetical protein
MMAAMISTRTAAAIPAIITRFRGSPFCTGGPDVDGPPTRANVLSVTSELDGANKSEAARECDRANASPPPGNPDLSRVVARSGADGVIVFDALNAPVAAKGRDNANGRDPVSRSEWTVEDARIAPLAGGARVATK